MWAKFHQSLREGAKRSLPRATRFIFLELSLISRPGKGRLRVAHGIDLVDALHDVIGGSRTEIAEAITLLSQPDDDGVPMLRVEEAERSRWLVLPKWAKYAAADTSTERSRRFRGKVADATQVQRAETPRNADATQVQRGGNDSRNESATSPSLSLSSSRSLSERERGVGREEPKGSAGEVYRELAKGQDLWPDADVAAAAVRVADKISEPTNKSAGDERLIAREAVEYARAWTARHPSSSPVQRLAEAERKAGWMLGDYRSGKRVVSDDAKEALERRKTIAESEARRIARESVTPEEIAADNARRAAMLAAVKTWKRPDWETDKPPVDPLVRAAIVGALDGTANRLPDEGAGTRRS